MDQTHSLSRYIRVRYIPRDGADMNSPVIEQFPKTIGNLQLASNAGFRASQLIAGIAIVYCLLPIVH
jgi:hypothetical protein